MDAGNKGEGASDEHSTSTPGWQTASSNTPW